MTLAWRIGADTPDYTADDLTGTGAKLTGGRWNRVGTAMLYVASSRALACLETVVHLGAADLPLNRYLVEIDLPDDLVAAALVFDPAANVGWDAIPEGKVSIDAGEQWTKKGASAVMVVPSVIVPEEVNYLINPRHPEAARVGVRKVRRWTYDSRMKPTQRLRRR